MNSKGDELGMVDAVGRGYGAGIVVNGDGVAYAASRAPSVDVSEGLCRIWEVVSTMREAWTLLQWRIACSGR